MNITEQIADCCPPKIKEEILKTEHIQVYFINDEYVWRDSRFVGTSDEWRNIRFDPEEEILLINRLCKHIEEKVLNAVEWVVINGLVGVVNNIEGGAMHDVRFINDNKKSRTFHKEDISIITESEAMDILEDKFMRLKNGSEDIKENNSSRSFKPIIVGNGNAGLSPIKAQVGVSNDGIGLIRQERTEQLVKHGRSIQADVELNRYNQLRHAAIMLLDGFPFQDEDNGVPFKWDEGAWNKMSSKSYKERLITAGALIAAEIDRFIESSEKVQE